MKNVRKEAQKVNLLKPVSFPDSPEGDCFGKEYSSHDKDCSLCADIETCAIKYQEFLQKKKNQFEKEAYPLDMSDFEGVSMKKIEILIKKYQDSGQPASMAEFIELIASLAKTQDTLAVTEWIKRKLPLSDLYIKDGYIYAGKNSSN